MKGVIVIDIAKCQGCKSCELSCAVEHSLSKDLIKAIREKPAPQSRVKVESVADLAVPLQCRHCEDAPCIRICPTSALKQSGSQQPVIIDEKLCIGCKWCILVCPFGVLNMNREGKAVIKCDLCAEKLKKDEQPACVLACPVKALKFLSLEEIAKGKRKDFLIRFTKEEKDLEG